MAAAQQFKLQLLTQGLPNDIPLEIQLAAELIVSSPDPHRAPSYRGLSCTQVGRQSNQQPSVDIVMDCSQHPKMVSRRWLRPLARIDSHAEWVSAVMRNSSYRAADGGSWKI